MDDVYYDPTGPMAILSGVEGCIGFLVGLLLLVIGFVTVRAALPNAGYMVGAGGALMVLTVCCGSWQNAAMMSGSGYELIDSFGGISSAAALLFHLAAMGLVIAGAVLLSLELTKRRGAAAPAASSPGGA